MQQLLDDFLGCVAHAAEFLDGAAVELDVALNRDVAKALFGRGSARPPRLLADDGLLATCGLAQSTWWFDMIDVNCPVPKSASA